MRLGLPKSALTVLLLASLVRANAQTQTTQTATTSVSDSQAVARDPQAIAVLQESLTALGGTVSPSSLKATGKYTTFGASGVSTGSTIELEALGFDKFRRTVQFADGTFATTIARGTFGWVITPRGTSALSLAQLAGIRAEDLPLLAISKWLNSQNVQLQSLGTVTFSGENLLHIGVRPTSNYSNAQAENAFEETSRCDIFVDPQTTLPARLRYYAHPQDWRVALPTDLVFSNFQAVNGVLLPFTITRYVVGARSAPLSGKASP